MFNYILLASIICGALVTLYFVSDGDQWSEHRQLKSKSEKVSGQGGSSSSSSVNKKTKLSIQEEYLDFFRNALLNAHYNYHAKSFRDGSEWPAGAAAVSMAGQRRLDNFASLVSMAIHDHVEGHIIETGVWRGGASFMAAKTVELLGEAHKRRVYLCDSFKGIPPAPKDREYDWYDKNAVTIKILNDNNVETVKRDAALFGLDMSHLRWVEGFFNDSLPALVQAEPDLKFAVVRLDGDTYFSTMDAIKVLYPRLSPGGFIIVDDYEDWPGCRDAIDTYRREQHITEPIVMVPHKVGETARGVYWRKGPLEEGMLTCPGHPTPAAPATPDPATGLHMAPKQSSRRQLAAGSSNSNRSLRPRNSYNPGNLVPMPPGGPKGISVLNMWNAQGVMICVE